MVFETDRLWARQMSIADLDFTAALLADPEVMRYYPKPLSRAEARAWIERQVLRYERDGHGLWLIMERHSNRPVGHVGLLLQMVDDARLPEVGYLIHRPFWRRGYATEAAQATRDYAFDVQRYATLISLIRPVNTPSRGVAERLGMRIDRTTTFAGGEHLVYSLSNPTQLPRGTG